MDFKDIQPYLDKIGEAITQIAHGLGVASEHVYGVLIRQQFVDGLVDVCISIIAPILYIIVMMYLLRLRKNIDSYWEDEVSAIVIIVGVGGFIATTVIFFNLFPDGLKHLINPEYYAMQQILDYLKSLKR